MKKLLFVFSVLLLSSCAVPFTTTMRTELESYDIDIKKIQFYNSNAFAFQRELSSSEAGIDDGKIVSKEGKRIEIVEIPRRKPAVCDSIDGRILYMKFEYGEDRGIVFISDYNNENFTLITSGTDPPSPIDVTNYSDVSWAKFYGTVNYDGKEYYYGYVDMPKLMVRKNQIENIVKESRRVKGIRIE